MGNRAYVVFEDSGELSPAVYLHWNGGAESLYQFLDALDRYEVRSDAGYAAARFVQIVGNYFGGGLSLGLQCFDRLEDLQPGDSGLYVVSRNGKERNVRRMVRGAVWLTPQQVERERLCAYRHAYALQGIAADIDAANREIFCPTKDAA